MQCWNATQYTEIVLLIFPFLQTNITVGRVKENRLTQVHLQNWTVQSWIWLELICDLFLVNQNALDPDFEPTLTTG